MAGGPLLRHMQIRITHSGLSEDLVQFLTRMGFAVQETDYCTFTVDIRDEEPAPRRAQLLLYLHVWQATRRGVSAFVVPADS